MILMKMNLIEPYKNHWKLIKMQEMYQNLLNKNWIKKIMKIIIKIMLTIFLINNKTNWTKINNYSNKITILKVAMVGKIKNQTKIYQIMKSKKSMMFSFFLLTIMWIIKMI